MTVTMTRTVSLETGSRSSSVSSTSSTSSVSSAAQLFSAIMSKFSLSSIPTPQTEEASAFQVSGLSFKETQKRAKSAQRHRSRRWVH
ncbi:hypothetical protein HDU79_011586 [Rhizoclosmatium sp. JEL0117]|nr:hypothetical protein HDU79_011586 [Rhizoclosmatium sp. JEL0117]